MGESDLMLDTHAVARSLTAADFTPAQGDALTDALRLVVEQGEHVTWRMLGIAGLVIAALRLLG